MFPRPGSFAYDLRIEGSQSAHEADLSTLAHLRGEQNSGGEKTHRLAMLTRALNNFDLTPATPLCLAKTLQGLTLAPVTQCYRRLRLPLIRAGHNSGE